MTKLGDVTQYLEEDLLQVTIRGREYTIPAASAELGLWCRATFTAATVEDDEQRRTATSKIPALKGEQTLAQVMLGDVYQQMVRDQVEDRYIEFVATVAYLDVVVGRDTAVEFYEAGGRPEARRPDNRASRRATGGNRTGGATKTPSQGSSSGTKSRKRSGKKRDR